MVCCTVPLLLLLLPAICFQEIIGGKPRKISGDANPAKAQEILLLSFDWEEVHGEFQNLPERIPNAESNSTREEPKVRDDPPRPPPLLFDAKAAEKKVSKVKFSPPPLNVSAPTTPIVLNMTESDETSSTTSLTTLKTSGHSPSPPPTTPKGVGSPPSPPPTTPKSVGSPPSPPPTTPKGVGSPPSPPPTTPKGVGSPPSPPPTTPKGVGSPPSPPTTTRKEVENTPSPPTVTPKRDSTTSTTTKTSPVPPTPTETSTTPTTIAPPSVEPEPPAHMEADETRTTIRVTEVITEEDLMDKFYGRGSTENDILSATTTISVSLGEKMNINDTVVIDEKELTDELNKVEHGELLDDLVVEKITDLKILKKKKEEDYYVTSEEPENSTITTPLPNITGLDELILILTTRTADLQKDDQPTDNELAEKVTVKNVIDSTVTLRPTGFEKKAENRNVDGSTTGEHRIGTNNKRDCNSLSNALLSVDRNAVKQRRDAVRVRPSFIQTLPGHKTGTIEVSVEMDTDGGNLVIDTTTTRKPFWKPYQMNCDEEYDDKGDICKAWASDGLCGSHRPTMFLFCRKTCLCVGPY